MAMASYIESSTHSMRDQGRPATSLLALFSYTGRQVYSICRETYINLGVAYITMFSDRPMRLHAFLTDSKPIAPEQMQCHA